MLENIKNNIELITKQQLMDWLQISKSKCDKLMLDIRHYKVGRIVRFNKEDVLKYLKENEVN